MKQMTLFLSLTFALLSVTTAHAECGRDKMGELEFGWCIDSAPGSKSEDVIYYMHGGGGSEKSWQETEQYADLVPAWKKLGFEVPKVITISFGESWLLGDLATSQHPALLAPFTEQIIPFLEAKLGGLKGQRLLMGHSMGGYNGAELALRNPNFFARVALLCPGISDVSAFATDKEIEDYLRRQPASTKRDYVLGLVEWVRLDFLTAENWERHNPISLARAATGLKTKFFTSCTKDDEYGFHDGAELFAKILKDKTDSRWTSIESGGHCAQSLESMDGLARFMAGVK